MSAKKPGNKSDALGVAQIRNQLPAGGKGLWKRLGIFQDVAAGVKQPEEQFTGIIVG